MVLDRNICMPEPIPVILCHCSATTWTWSEAVTVAFVLTSTLEFSEAMTSAPYASSVRITLALPPIVMWIGASMRREPELKALLPTL